MASLLGSILLHRVVPQHKFYATFAVASLYLMRIPTTQCAVLTPVYKHNALPALYSGYVNVRRLLSADAPGKIKEVIFEQLKEMLDSKNVTLVDVREPKELETDGKIPGSVNIPSAQVEGAFKLSPEEFKEHYGIPLPKKDDPNLVFSCRSGRRATAAIEKVQALGFSNARCYCGSFLDWVEKGGPIEKP